MKRSFLLLALIVGSLPKAASACALCMSGADSHYGEALNGAIFLMLGFLALIFSAVAAVAISFARRSRSLPDHMKFVESLNAEAIEPLS